MPAKFNDVADFKSTDSPVAVTTATDLPDQLLQAANGTGKLLIAVQYWDIFENTLDILKQHQNILSILVVNRLSVAKYAPLQNWYSKFNYVVEYEGPRFDDSNIGNLKFVETSDEVYRTPNASRAVEQVIDALKPRLNDNAQIYIGTTNEELVYDVALLRQKYGIPGMAPEQVQNMITKSKHPRVLVGSNVQSPWSIPIKINLKENHIKETNRLLSLVKETLPVFVKPEEGCGSFGTFLVKTKDQMSTWVKSMQNWKCDSCLIQEYLPGRQHAFTLVTAPDKTMRVVAGAWTVGHWHEVINKGTSCGMIWHLDDDPEYEKIKKTMLKTAAMFGCNEYPGIYYAEFIEDQNGAPKLADITCRPVVSCFLNLATEQYKGIDVEAIQLLGHLLDEKLANFGHHNKRIHPIGVAFWPDKKGVVTSYNLPPNLPPDVKLLRYVQYHEPGHECQSITTTSDIACEIGITASSQKQLIEAISKLLLFVPVTYEMFTN